MVRKGILCIKIFKWSDIIFITNIYTYKLTKYTAKKMINKNEYSIVSVECLIHTALTVIKLNPHRFNIMKNHFDEIATE